MPMYDYFCAKCHKNQGAFRSVDGRGVGPACKKCGHTMNLVTIPKPTKTKCERPDVRDPFQKV